MCKGDMHMKKELTFEEKYEKVVAMIEANSPYKRIPGEKKYITASEMGKLLGLKKTERYWLLHKHYFEWEEILGEYRVSIPSFEKWYANQVKYKKVTGEEPGKELKEWSYSPMEIAELLGICSTVVYDILKTNNIKTVIVDYNKRVPKDAFYEWYNSQSRYRTKEDKEKDKAIMEATISMPEMARLLRVERHTVYGILSNPKYKNLFEFVIVADRKRITKRSFEAFLDAQDSYYLFGSKKYKETSFEKDTAIADYHRRNVKDIPEEKYITCEEAAEMAGVVKSTVSKWASKNLFQVQTIGKTKKILKSEFEKFLKTKEERRKANGIY